MAGHSQYKETLWPWRPRGRLTHALARHTDPHTTEPGATLINPTSSLALPPAAAASTFLFPPAPTPIFLLISTATSPKHSLHRLRLQTRSSAAPPPPSQAAPALALRTLSTCFDVFVFSRADGAPDAVMSRLVFTFPPSAFSISHLCNILYSILRK